MKKFIYVMFEDIERVVENPADVCRILSEILCEQASEAEQNDETSVEAKRVTAAWHLFAYHSIVCESFPDALNLALAHKAIVEEGQDWVEAYERVS